jgi:hypothetical protein
MQVLHESSGYVFEQVHRGGWVGGVRSFSQRGSTASARTCAHVTGYSLSQESVGKIGKMFPEVVDVMRDTFVRRQKIHSGAMWKVTWMKHRHTILTQAAEISRPPHPWPAPRQRAESLIKAEAKLDLHKKHRRHGDGEEEFDEENL